MHETTKRWIIRMLLLVACGLPTASVVAFAVRIRLPAYGENIAAELGALLGASIAIETITHPRPYETRLSRVSVTDLESNRVLLRADDVGFRRTDLGYELKIRAAELNSHGFVRDWDILHERFLTQVSDTAAIVSLKCEQLELNASTSRQVLYDVRGLLEREPALRDTLTAGKNDGTPRTTAQLKLSFRSSTGTARAAQLRADRTFQAGQHKTDVSLDLADAMLNVTTACPQLGEFVGPAAMVGGRIRAEYFGRRWSGHLTDVHCESIDCRLILDADRVPDKFTGTASISDLNVDFVDERLTTFSGDFQATNGEILRRTFLDDAIKVFALIPRQDQRLSNSGLTYQQIRFQFQGTDSGLRIIGLRSDGANKPVMIGNGISIKSNGETVPYERVFEFLERWD